MLTKNRKLHQKKKERQACLFSQWQRSGRWGKFSVRRPVSHTLCLDSYLQLEVLFKTTKDVTLQKGILSA